MQQLVARLSALDAEAGAALKVITYFDKLNEGRVSLETLVRGAAVLSGSAAGLCDPERHLNLRVLPDRSAAASPTAPDPAWLTIPVLEDSTAVTWLETSERRAIDELILERLVVSVRAALDRTRRRVVRDDAAALEVLLSRSVTDAVRTESARRLGLAPLSRVRAIAVLPDDGVKYGVEIDGVCAFLEPIGGADAARPSGRQGLGEYMPVMQAWQSWEHARIALRFTATARPDDPGPRTVRYSDLGVLATLADALEPGAAYPGDVTTIEGAAESAPWLLETLYHVVMHSSLRAASAAAHLHHSTLQDRVAHAEQLLGWPLLDPCGRLRLHVALVARNLLHTP